MENKQIDWGKLKTELQEDMQCDFKLWSKDKRTSTILETYIAIKFLLEKQLEL